MLGTYIIMVMVPVYWCIFKFLLVLNINFQGNSIPKSDCSANAM